MKLTRIHYFVFVLLLFIQLNNTSSQQLENLGRNISSEVSELGPLVSTFDLVSNTQGFWFICSMFKGLNLNINEMKQTK